MSQLFENIILSLLFTSLIMLLVTISYLVLEYFKHLKHRTQFLLMGTFAIILSIAHSFSVLVHFLDIHNFMSLVFILSLNIICAFVYLIIGKKTHYLVNKKVFFITLILFGVTIITQVLSFYFDYEIIEIIEELSPVFIVVIFFFSNIKYHDHLVNKS